MAEFLYIHIPFCARKCIYCDFLSVPYDEALAEQYTNALCRELELKKDLAGTLKTVFVGGGTPSILPNSCLDRMFACIADNYNRAENAEITVEANPGTLTEAKVRTLISRGVNRLSLGIQSFSNSELRTLGRIHNAETAIQSAEMVRLSGMENFSLDLIYGIPGQDMQTWKDSLQQAIALSPKHISAYELTPEPGTPLRSSLDSGDCSMPGEELVLDMSDFAVDRLSASGYEQYEISNYSLPGYRCAHNLNYWDRGDYLAAGAGAHGFIKGYRTRNTSSIKQYIEKLENDTDPEMEKTALSREDALREFVFLGLRKTEGIRLDDAAEFGLDLAAASDELFRLRLVESTTCHLRLTRKGQHIANEVIVRLLGGLGL
ncbi:MAG: radical SAM family heme chaperone HemW [Nitrospirae bacterium]|nr:radical SAM family heme chaperone HemW [Nitrospirota bacterium]